jgi:hypothetical protein
VNANLAIITMEFKEWRRSCRSRALHVYLNWAKERIDEMDAALASFEAKASQTKADLRPRVDQLIVDLKKRRDEFQASLQTVAEASEATWARTRADMEAQWNDFEAQVKTYFEKWRHDCVDDAPVVSATFAAGTLARVSLTVAFVTLKAALTRYPVAVSPK